MSQKFVDYRWPDSVTWLGRANTSTRDSTGEPEATPRAVRDQSPDFGHSSQYRTLTRRLDALWSVPRTRMSDQEGAGEDLGLEYPRYSPL